MTRNRLGGWFGFVLGVLLLAGGFTPASAQVTAAISGRVEDATGASMGGTTVTVKSLETGATRSTTTDETGNYRILSLPVGPQEVRAEKAGFRSAIRTGINLAVAQEAVVNLKLDIGQVAQEVTVSGDTALVDTTTASVSGLVTEREIKELPLNGRSFDSLITLNPGSINYTYKSPGTVTSSGLTFSVAGRRPLDNIFLMNGIEYTGSSQLAITPGGVSGYLLGIDAVREFNVQSGTYSAEYGKRAGAQVTVVTQSGTNQFHGSAFEFLRNSAMDARTIFDVSTSPGVNAKAAPFRRNQFGGSFGGPIKTDRLFFFGNYEGFRHRLGVGSVAVVPDQNVRLGQVPSPSTGAYTPVTNLSQDMLKYFQLWPDVNGPEIMVPASSPGTGLVPSGSAYSYNSPKQSINEDFGTLKGDYSLRKADSLSVAYTIDDGNNLSPLPDPLFANYLTLRSQVASIRETHIVSPHMVNTFSTGLSRAAFALDSSMSVNFSPTLSFVTGQGPGGIIIGGTTSTTAAAALTSAGPNNAAGARNQRNLFTFTDSLQIVRGAHQFSVGGWFQKIQDNENTASRRLGVANFATMTAFLQGTLSPATGFQVVPKSTELAFRSWFGAWYAEDSMRLRRNLTLRAGVRHEFTNGWNEKFGRAANYVTGPDGILKTDPIRGNSVFTENKAKWLFSPRVALAWDPFGKGKTAVRAGFGIYYSLIDNLSFLLNSLPPYNGSATFTGPLSNVLPIAAGVAPPDACIANAPAGSCSIFAPQGIEPAAKTPAVNEWNLTIEQQLGASTTIRVGYIGSFGYHSLLSLDPNTIPAQICTDPAGCNGGVVPQGTRYIQVQPAPPKPASTARPNPFLGAGFFWYTAGNSSYNALQLEVNRRLSRSLQFRANYTWAKNLDMNSALTIAQAQNQPQMVYDRTDLHRDWGPSALTPGSQASISAHYDLPFSSKNAKGAARLISGWQLNGITTLLSGFPFTPLTGSNRSADGNTRNPDRPNWNTAFSGPVLLKKQTQWFDPSAFVPPTPGTFGSVGRGVLRGPSLADFDLALMKNTTLTERVDLQFRAEFFNAFNHVNLGPPNSTVFSGTGTPPTPSPSAGLISTLATDSRRVQLGLKILY
jgi:hypothetical protein